MDNIIEKIFLMLIGGTIPVVAIIYLIIMNPEKIEIWISIIFKFFSSIFQNYVSFKKNYIKFDLQGRVNTFTKTLGDKVPSLSEYKLKLEWVNPSNIDRKSFLDGNNVILRLKKEDPRDENFVHGAYSFVSHCLLMPIKRHISEAQKISVDTYVTAELIKTEKPQIFNFFAEKYIHAYINNKDKKKYFKNYQVINEHGYFFEVLLQEMDYIGRKVITNSSKNLLIKEYDEIIEFLSKTSNRCIGDDDTDLDYRGQYSNMLIIIIGKSQKINTPNVYLDFLTKETKKRNVETIYAVGAVENKKAIEDVFRQFNNEYDFYHSGVSDTMLNYKDGTNKKVKQYFCILRKSNRQLVV